MKPKRVKNNLIEYMTSLVGVDALINLLMKYRYNLDPQIRKGLEVVFVNPEKFEHGDMKSVLKSQVPEDSKDFFDEETYNLLVAMMEPDPELRPTIV